MSTNTVLVTCYQNPDLDGFAGATAYAEFLNRTGIGAVAGIFGDVHDEVKWVMEKFKFIYPESVADPAKFDRVVFVDASTAGGLPMQVRLENVIEVIDHRRWHEAHLFPRARLQIELVGSAATLIAERFEKASLVPSFQSAALLSAAIISNTLNFKAAVTTERDRSAAARLKNSTNLSDSFAREMFLAKSDLSGDALQKRMRNEFASYLFGVVWHDGAAIRPGLIMRKEIMPLVKDYLENVR